MKLAEEARRWCQAFASSGRMWVSGLESSYSFRLSMTDFHVEDTKLTFGLCACYSQVDQKAAKQRQSSGSTADIFWIDRSLKQVTENKFLISIILY